MPNITDELEADEALRLMHKNSSLQAETARLRAKTGELEARLALVQSIPMPNTQEAEIARLRAENIELCGRLTQHERVLAEIWRLQEQLRRALDGCPAERIADVAATVRQAAQRSPKPSEVDDYFGVACAITRAAAEQARAKPC